VTANGAFDFTLRTPFAAELYLLSEDVPNGVNITPADVKGVSIYEFIALKDGNLRQGTVSKIKRTAMSMVRLIYIYANKAAVVTGTGEDGFGDGTFIYNMTLTAGWNIVVEEREYSGSMYICTSSTGDVPTDLQWTFDGYAQFWYKH
jgi:hypothetical protein